jgi:transposase-like protein
LINFLLREVTVKKAPPYGRKREGINFRDNKNTGGTMKKYSKEEREWLVEEWGQSGKSKWAFAKEMGLSVQTLNNWTRNGLYPVR